MIYNILVKFSILTLELKQIDQLVNGLKCTHSLESVTIPIMLTADNESWDRKAL